MSLLSVLLVAAALLHCGLTTTPATGVRITNTELFSGYDLKQWLAYHIGRVECLKTLLSEGNTQYGLGAILHGNYTTDITRFSLRQQTAFLTGVVQCFNFHLSLEGNRTNTSDNCNNHRMEQDSSGLSQKPVAYIDCKDAYQNGHTTSGVYTINPDNQTEFKVYCDMDTNLGGWTVIQRRIDGSVSFDRNWTEYESGFGNKTREYWLGLSYMHRLTTSASQDLRVDLEDFEGGSAYAHYSKFTVLTATKSYRMRVSGYSGTAGDALYYNSGRKFTTRDRDNDQAHDINCATKFKAPWWHKRCSYANLNGKYCIGRSQNGFGIKWYQWKSNWIPLKTASMKLRRK